MTDEMFFMILKNTSTLVWVPKLVYGLDMPMITVQENLNELNELNELKLNKAIK